MITFETKAWQRGFCRVAGMDEAGRGPLAGPVVACAVLIQREFMVAEAAGILSGINDSKKITPKRREAFFKLLTGDARVSFAFGIVAPEEIDRINILRATHLAMAQAVKQLSVPPDCLLVDGLSVPGLSCHAEFIVGGDGKSLSIAAASILAKVRRDRIMDELDALYPGYGFSRHRGYGTALHLDALRRLGPCPCHRRTFAPVARCQLPLR